MSKPNDQPLVADVVDEFYDVLIAATIPQADGSRIVPDAVGGVLLSEAANRLHLATARLVARLVAMMRPTTLPPGLSLEVARTPDGPWDPAPEGASSVFAQSLRNNVSFSAALAAIQRVADVSAFPVEKWNRLQAESPGSDHQRYRAGDRINENDLKLVASLEQLLKLVDESTLPEADRTIERAKLIAVHRHPAEFSERARSQPELLDDQATHVLELRGDVWNIRFPGSSGLIAETQRDGLWIIQLLLENPERPFLVLDLLAQVDGHPLASKADSPDPALDEEGLRRLRAACESITSEREEAERNGDSAKCESLALDETKLISEYKSRLGLSGRPRESGLLERARGRVYQRIQRAKQRLRAGGLANLATHLDFCVQTGQCVVYVPDRPIDWRT